MLTVSPETASILRTLTPAPRLPQDPTNRYADDPAAAHFGQFMFFDTALSASGALSCATCHKPEMAFADGLPRAVASEEGRRNTPSIINAAHFAWLNWDGSADTLWGQAARPFEAEHELATTRTSIARLIGTDPDRRAAYEAIFESLPPVTYFEALPERAMPVLNDPKHPDQLAWDSMTDEQKTVVNSVFVNLCKAIAAYQMQLVAANSPFDRFAQTVRSADRQHWVGREVNGFGIAELRGLELFTGDAGCIACHAGPMFSDFTFHGVRVPPFHGGAPDDSGRFEGLGALLENPLNSAGPFSDAPDAPVAERLRFMKASSESWGMFRTPSLRNVALTDPYMHAGQFEDLDRVLDHYSTFEGALPPDNHAIGNQLLRPLNLSSEQKSDLKAFLLSLTDTNIPQHLTRPPEAPLPVDPQAKTGR